MLAGRIANRCVHRVRIAAMWDVSKNTSTRANRSASTNRATRAGKSTRASNRVSESAIMGPMIRPMWALYVGMENQIID